jgi:hypothetical protein
MPPPPLQFVYYSDAQRARSYFSLEREVNGEVGRVVRFDSFSKILSSGPFSSYPLLTWTKGTNEMIGVG